MPLALANLYTTPQDVYDLVGVDAVQLREDDLNLATGQTITTTAAAALAATSITVAALEYALLKGSVLVFDNAGMDTPVEATLTAAAIVGATTLTVSALGAAIASGGKAVDNGVNVWLASLMLKGCKYATAQVKSYCCGRYNDSDLANSWSVNRWATAIAARWIAKRRYQAAPDGIESEFQETILELKSVQVGQLNIEDIGTRAAGWPFMSNVTLDDRYTYRKARVEAVISEPGPTQYPQSIDYNSIMSFEF